MTWGGVGDIAVWVVAGALLVVMIWAAIERGRAHQLAARHHALTAKDDVGEGDDG